MASVSQKMTMVQALNLALHQEMQRDDDVLVMGQDVGVNGGVFRVTAGLQEQFGQRRVLDTPLAESGIVGTALGMAVGGLRPVAEIQFSGFAFVAFGQIEGNIARYRSRTQGQWTVPMVIRMPYGGGVRALEHHSESREAIFASIAGLKVVIPSGPRNARALLAAAIQDPDPVIFMEPKHSYRAFKEEVPEQAETLPIGQAQVVRGADLERADVTVVSWGAMMPATLRAADEVKQRRGARIQVIDLLTISPLDSDTVLASVKRSGRCVIVQEAPRSFGLSSELVARINDEALLWLEAPVERVTHSDVVTPYFQREQLYMPNQQSITEAIDGTLDFN
ncbi:MAG: alpha-ketoacid dehydrogenase subunit beta [Deltaproteobacteria bacterium]|jgi:pyruvate dehydrogenase E1 component beta subunit|nr:alpha-ketoacid dehydrogenase subunit beta [Deltaproteobacteria bacterium]